MAKQKMDRKKLERYTSLAFPESIRVLEEEDKETTDKSGDNKSGNNGVNTIGDALKRSELERNSALLAGGSSTLPVAEVTQKSSVTPQYSGNNPTPANIVQPSFARPGFTPDVTGDVPNTSLPGFAQRESSVGALPPFSFNMPDVVQRQAPILFGNVDINNIARAVLSEDTPTQSQTVAKMSPEEKLLATLANTNPAPNSLWKRLLVGASRGAAGITPNDDLSTAFGRILGGAVTRAIPAIDSANQYQENKQRALEQYQLESGAQNAALQRDTRRQSIANDQARITAEVQQRARQARIDTENQLERLKDNKRAEARQKLDTLEKMSPDDPNRQASIEELQRNYGISVGADYGTYSKPPRAKEASETDLRKQATDAVNLELGATTEERARGAVKNKLEAELKRQMPPDQYAALTDQSAGQFTRQAALKLRNEIEDRMYKVDLDYTKSDFERRVASKMQELRGGVTQRKPVAKQASNKVQASSRAQGTDARTLRFK